MEKFLVFKGKDDQWYFHLQAANNEIVAQSEGYTTKQSCIKGVEAVRTASKTAKLLIEVEHT